MKRIILISFWVFIALGAYSQGYMHSKFIVEGDYSRTEKFGLHAALGIDCRSNSGNGVNLGYQAGPGKHSFNLAYQMGTDGFTDDDFAYIENRYLYRRFTSFGLQEFNAVLTLGYRNIHWNFQLGLCNRYIAEVPLRKNGGEGVIFEPMNVVFDIEYNLFPLVPPENPTSRFSTMHSWNIGCGISNYREFIIERVTLFYYTIHGYYDIDEQWRITGEAGLHPAGVLNLSAQYNGFFVNIGCTYKY